MPASYVKESLRQLGRTPSRKAQPTGFGAWLRENRLARGWTGEMLAERASTSSAVISNLERGIRNPSRLMIEKLAQALYEGDEAGYSRFEARALESHGFASSRISEDDLLEEDAREAGFDNFMTMFTDEEKEQIRDEFTVLRRNLLRGVIEARQRRR